MEESGTLTVTRKVGQEIILQTSDGEIRIYFAQFKSSNQLSVRVTAPHSVKIQRSEWLEKNLGKYQGED